MSFYLFLPAGCKAADIKAVPYAGKPKGDDWKREFADLTAAILYFGPGGRYTAVFDDEGLLCDNPIGTLEINRQLIHGPVMIWRTSGENMKPLTQEDVDYLRAHLKLLEGKGMTAAQVDGLEPKVISFETMDQLFDHMRQQHRFTDKENNHNFPKKED